MTLRRWFFNVLPSGTTLNTSNVLASDGAAASIVSAGSGGTIQSSDVQVHHGDTAMRFAGGGSASQAARLPFVAANNVGAFEIYRWVGAMTAVDICNVRHASGQLFRVGITSAGAIQVKDSTGNVLGSSGTGAIVASSYYRIAVKFDNSGGSSAGTVDVEAYAGDSMTATGTLSLTAVNLGTAAAASIDIGSPNSAVYTEVQYFDSIQMDDGATSFIGPYTVANQPPQVTAGPAQTVAAATVATLSFSATDVDGTIASRATSFDLPASGGPSITGGTGDTPSFTTESAPRLYIVKHEATDNNAAVGSATTEVRVPTTASGTSNPVAMDATAEVGTWALVGSATTDGAALADADDATYVESGAITSTSQEITVRLLPRAALASGSITVRLSTDTGTATATVRLRRGTTIIQTWTQDVTSTPTDYVLELNGSAVDAANLDPGDLRISVAVAS